MKRVRANTNDSPLAGVTPILLVWVLGAALIGAIYRRQITRTIQWSFLLELFLTASGLLSPIYGGLVYFGARRRDQRRKARASAITTTTLFLVSLASAAVIFWLLRMLGSVG